MIVLVLWKRYNIGGLYVDWQAYPIGASVSPVCMYNSCPEFKSWLLGEKTP